MADFVHAELPCYVLKVERFGTWNGYVGVPPAHPWHGLSYDDVAADVVVHGDVTYAGPGLPTGFELEVPPVEEGFWFFGFDTAHAWDYIPAFAHLQLGALMRDTTYKDEEYVTKETRSLAEQLAAVWAKAT